MITNHYDPLAPKPKLKTGRVYLYQPEREWTYSHHPHLAFFDGRYIAIWSNGLVGEDEPGQRVLISTSLDFVAWSEPVPLIDSLPGQRGPGLILTAGGLHHHNGLLVAYAGAHEADRSGTRLVAVTSRNGQSWSPIQEVGLPVVPNHGPQRIAGGRLILASNITFPYTDDPYGLSGWRMAGIAPPELGNLSDNPWSFGKIARGCGWPAAFCEGSFYQTEDGVLHMLLRVTGEGHLGRLWVTESRDHGETWSTPTETGFSDNDAKFHFGRLPDGRFYYVGNPDPQPRGRRSPLVLSLSEDGETFYRHFVIADEHYEMKRPGRHKGGEHGYPHTLVHAGCLHVIVSRQKEAVEVIRFSLNDLS